MTTYWYIASPYSDPDPKVSEQRYRAALRATHWCLTHDMIVFSPIVHCHEMAIIYGMPTDFRFWKAYNNAMISGSSGLLVLEIEGWQQSAGVSAEREIAVKAGLPVGHLLPEKGGYYLSY